MANTSSIFGARWIGTLQGNATSGQVRSYVVPATDNTAIFMGDFVTHQGTAAVDDEGVYYPVVAQSAASNKVTGFVVGVKASRTYENQIYRSAATLRTLYVVDDPYALFEIQCNATLTAEHIGLNANIIVGSGSTTTGISGMQLDVSTILNTATLPLRIVGIVPRVDNELGAYTKAICMMNYTTWKDTTGV